LVLGAKLKFAPVAVLTFLFAALLATEMALVISGYGVI
jgi:hypothetical protein